MTDDVWLIDSGPSRETRLPLPTRAALIRLGSGDLWLYAPTRLTKSLRAEIDAIGPLRHIVVPTPTHLGFVGDWWEAYPNAKLWTPAGVTSEALTNIPSCPDLRLLQPDKAENEWQDDLRQVVVQGNPSHQ
ncbi:MAG: DUF4336 domain-containing protein, partial [Pseudomonadota bacterium]